ncbi:mitoferrin-1-like [Sycon ciliatum]|uniref:mitoferrin-1-like n=1 Tax=Sycon ciliatum TaxID=27933 RepID=UPI0020AB4842|eukprot:scpid72858/ scgid9376/ Mitoferrin-1; Mitochondrial iron transporter 1; Mitochondrial solute carrier protein; Solute carrier family 25 member 37
MEEEYESLPTNKISSQLLAGAAAGIAEHSVMYPFDVVKTRMQSLRPHPVADYRGVGHAVTQIVQLEGLRTPFRGLSAVVVGAGPAHALYFAAYESIKRTLSPDNPGQSSAANLCAGAVATLIHDGFMNPVDVIKQRMQMYGSPHRNIAHCIKTTFRTEGMRAFYRSYTTQLTMNIPFQCTQFVVYEKLRRVLNPSGQYNPLVHSVAGAGAGACAAALSNPLDVAKTLLNTQEASVRQVTGREHVSGMLLAMRTIYAQNGLAGYSRGLSARILYQMPATAVSWSVYELLKYLLHLHPEDRIPQPPPASHEKQDSVRTS